MMCTYCQVVVADAGGHLSLCAAAPAALRAAALFAQAVALRRQGAAPAERRLVAVRLGETIAEAVYAAAGHLPRRQFEEEFRRVWALGAEQARRQVSRREVQQAADLRWELLCRPRA